MSGILTISKYAAVPCKKHSQNNLRSLSDRTKTSNTIQEFSVCYSASHIPQSLPQPPHCPLVHKHLSSYHFPIQAITWNTHMCLCREKPAAGTARQRRNTNTVKVAQEVQQWKVIFLGLISLVPWFLWALSEVRSSSSYSTPANVKQVPVDRCIYMCLMSKKILRFNECLL